MSELINNNLKRKEMLKHLILQLHEGKSAAAMRKQLLRLLGKVPYNMVVEAEQELIAEGLPAQEVLKLCDVHGEALKGAVDLTEAREAPPGHPLYTFKRENEELAAEIRRIQEIYDEIRRKNNERRVTELWLQLREHFHKISDVDKHYRRKENLLFPYLEKYEITGPPKVMWGKDDEIRQQLKSAIKTLTATKDLSAEEAEGAWEWTLKPALSGIDEMISKEEEILFPMCMDTLTELDWFEIYRQSDEIGYCLYDPEVKWQPQGISEKAKKSEAVDKINLSTGKFTMEELSALFNTLPVDITFVDQNDTVRFFSNNPDRIFDRNRAILGRKVQMCHPPSSVHVVQKIIDDFRSGQQNKASFWIQKDQSFILIEYYALRNSHGKYLGVLEVTQDATEVRKLEGERRLLNYENI